MKALWGAGAAAMALFAATHSEAAVRSVSKIEFGPPGVLFIADWKGGEVHALSLPETASGPARPFNLLDVQGPIEHVLGTRTFKVEDMKAPAQFGRGLSGGELWRQFGSRSSGGPKRWNDQTPRSGPRSRAPARRQRGPDR